MRKAMALFLAMLMAISMVPMAFAEEGNETADDPAGDGNETVEPEEPEADGNETEEPEDNETEEPEDEDEEEEEDVVEIPENVTDEAGTLPGSWTWGIDRALERISMSITFGKSAKAKKGLVHARERLMEVQAMIAQKRMAQAARAQEAYDDIMEGVQENVDALGNGDEIGDLEDETELEAALAENEDLVEQVGKLKTKFKGLTPEEEDAVNAIVGSLGDSTTDAKVQVQMKKNKTKIKIKAKGGLTDEEVAAIAAQVEEAVAKGEKVQVKIKAKKNKKGETEYEYESESEDESEDEEEGDESEDEDDGSDVKGKPEKDKGDKGKGKDK